MSVPADDVARDRAHLIHSLHAKSYVEQPHVWTAGRGAVLIDSHGGEFLDGLSGLWNVAIGHGREELADVAARQMKTLAYASAYAGGTSRPAIELGERLAEICYPSINRFFFTCGGAESSEAAFKTARYFWKLSGKPDKTKIVGRVWGYHGTTLAAMSATGISSYWPLFAPRVPGFLHIASPYPYRFEAVKGDQRTPGEQAADLLEDLIVREGAETIAAFIGEPVQGAGGVIVPPDDYWPRIRQICDRHDVLLIADEVITGFGRTGFGRTGIGRTGIGQTADWFALSRYGIEPDMLTFAKGVTSGYFPLGGLGINDRVAKAFDEADGPKTWMHAHTYSGHPVGCAVALENLAIIEREGLRQRATALGERLQRGLATLSSHRHVGDVRGLGLMGAVEFVADRATKAEFRPEEKVGPRVHLATQKRGMITRLRGDVYNLAPCYVTEESQLDRMIEILGASIEDVLGQA